jgi:hypothetical protein
MVAQLTIEEAQVLEQPQVEETQLYTFEEFVELPDPEDVVKGFKLKVSTLFDF